MLAGASVGSWTGEKDEWDTVAPGEQPFLIDHGRRADTPLMLVSIVALQAEHIAVEPCGGNPVRPRTVCNPAA